MTKITLRQGEGAQRNIKLYALDVPIVSQTTKIFLYPIVATPPPTCGRATITLFQGEASPTNIRLKPVTASCALSSQYTITLHSTAALEGVQQPSVATYTYAGSGGLVFHGLAPVNITMVYPGAGGLVFAGTAPKSLTHAYLPTGGIVFGGAATLAQGHVYLPSGGIVLAGAAVLAQAHAYAPAGGIVFAGSATLAQVHAYVPAGGLIFGGVGATSFVPAAGGTVFAYVGAGGFAFGGAARTAGPDNFHQYYGAGHAAWDRLQQQIADDDEELLDIAMMLVTSGVLNANFQLPQEARR